MNNERLGPEESLMDIEKMNKAAEEQGLPPLVRKNPDGTIEALPAEEARALESMLKEEKVYEPVRPGDYFQSLRKEYFNYARGIEYLLKKRTEEIQAAVKKTDAYKTLKAKYDKLRNEHIQAEIDAKKEFCPDCNNAVNRHVEGIKTLAYKCSCGWEYKYYDQEELVQKPMGTSPDERTPAGYYETKQTVRKVVAGEKPPVQNLSAIEKERKLKAELDPIARDIKEILVVHLPEPPQPLTRTEFGLSNVQTSFGSQENAEEAVQKLSDYYNELKEYGNRKD